ncbi:MAG: TlpA family protein disulfide reductase [Nitrospinota bacterium]
MEGPSIQRLYEAHRSNKDFAFFAVNVGEIKGVVAHSMKKRGWTFPALLDTRDEVSQAYGITGHPESFLIDRIGRIAAFAVGPRNWQSPQAETHIDRLLAEKGTGVSRQPL